MGAARAAHDRLELPGNGDFTWCHVLPLELAGVSVGYVPVALGKEVVAAADGRDAVAQNALPLVLYALDLD